METTKVYEFKDHPFFRQVLTYNAKRAVDEFAYLLKKDKVTNAELSESLVIKALDAMIQDTTGSFRYKYEPGQIMFRSRTISDAKEIIDGNLQVEMSVDDFRCKGYDEPNSIEPPLYKPKAARNNIDGVSYMYLAEDPYTACAEVRPFNHSLVSLARFQINKPIEVIDFNDDHDVSAFSKFENDYDLFVGPLFTSIMRYYTIPSIDSSIYKVTQFITDYIRKAGFSGIRYKSSMSAGANLTLFNCHKSIISYVDSEIILSNCVEYHLISFNSGEEINCKNDLSWKKENISEARKELNDTVSKAKASGK